MTHGQAAPGCELQRKDLLRGDGMNPGGRRATSPTTPAGGLDALSDVFATDAEFDAWYAQILPRVYGCLYARCGPVAPLRPGRRVGR
jgi:hypothetical protein